MLSALGLRRKPPPQPPPGRPLSPLEIHARRYAAILQLLYARRGLGGKLKIASRGARHMSFGVRLNDPTALDKAVKLAESIALASRSKAVLSYRQSGLIIYQYQLPEMYWEHYTRADVTGLGLGLGDMRRQVDFQFKDNAPHSGFFGTTGSGKTEALKSAMLAMIGEHTPDQLRMVLVDPYHNFDPFANVGHLITPIAGTPETIDSALLYANQVFEHRKAENIKDDYRLVIIIDEGDELLVKDERRIGIVQNLVNGRQFKVNVVLSSLKPLHSTLPGILDKLQNRFVGLVSDPNISYQLSGRAGLKAHELTGQGDFFHLVGPHIERFQVAMATQRDYANLPRAEVPAAPQVDLSPAITLPESKPAGRPPNELQPDTLALYMQRGPGNISYRQAKEGGITRTAHQRHQNFAQALLAELEALGLHLCGGEAT